MILLAVTLTVFVLTNGQIKQEKAIYAIVPNPVSLGLLI